MPTEKTELRLTFTTEEVLSALHELYQIETANVHVQAKVSGKGLFNKDGNEFISLGRPLESLTLLSYDPDKSTGA